MTIDEYYDRFVQNIYPNVFDYLEKDANKTFTHAEIKFFSMWWYKQTEELKTRFRKLVKEGRWEFVNGGMV